MSSLILGIKVLSVDTKNNVNRSFALLAFCVALWIIVDFSLYQNSLANFQTYLNRLDLAIICLMVLSLAYFVSLFPRKIFQINKFFSVLILSVTAILIFIILFTKQIIDHAFMENYGSNFLQGNLFFLFAAFASIFALYSIVILIIKYRRFSGIAKQQIKFIFYGIGLLTILNLTFNLFIPMFTKSFVYGRFGSYSAIFLVGFIAYTILVHHLFDIRIIIKKTLVYSGLLAFVLVTYALVVLSLSVLMAGKTAILGGNGILTFKAIFPNFVAAILIALGFGPLNNFLSRITDKWLFKGEYDSQEVLTKLSDGLTAVVDLDEALEIMMKNITSAMRVKTAATFVLRKNSDTSNLEVKRVKCIGCKDEENMGSEIQPLINYLTKLISNDKRSSDIVITEELAEALQYYSEEETQKALENLHSLNAGLVIPIFIKEKSKDKIDMKETIGKKNILIGIFILGEKLSGDIFSDKDLNLLNIAVKQTAAAIEKARFYEEDVLKTEFVSIASHELLTPVSAIQGYLSMILEEHLGKVDKKAQGYLEKVYTSSKRLAELIKELLNVSRIEEGRIIIQWQAFDVGELINTVIDELLPKANERGLKLAFTNYKSQKIIVFADKERVHQVLVNLLGNAIKYSEKGAVNCKISEAEGTFATFEITDTGIGIRPEDQKHLFEKFYRASNASSKGASGSGLGLYITKSLIEMMNGKIWFKSKTDEGTTFYFTLKIATPNEIKEHSQDPQGPGYVSSGK